MKVALISDVHSNLEALNKVLRDIERQGVEKIHFLGDVVGYGCNPNECVKLVNKHCDIKLLGNHDYAVMGLESLANFNQMAQASIEWTQTVLSRKATEFLADFEMEASYLDYHLVHSAPGIPEEWHYILSPDQAAIHFDSFNESVCFIGHSHSPAVFARDIKERITTQTKTALKLSPDNKYLINIGSVGQPRDNDPRACYVILDTDRRSIRYRRVEYDIEKTQSKMRKAMLPDFLVERIAVGR